jgi:hypothetical protein
MPINIYRGDIISNRMFVVLEAREALEQYKMENASDIKNRLY